MRRRRLALALLLTTTMAMTVTACDEPQTEPVARRIIGANFVQPVLLKASDDVVVHALDYRSARPRAVILLFHQAGSSKAEYNQIAARLLDQGFNALAIDQRSGGDMFGVNETVAARGKSTGYAEARPDLEAALAWAKGQDLPIILWGSSYSAALVFELAAAHPGEIAGVMAFSPGEYVGEKGSVAAAAAKVDVPIFVTAAQNPDEQKAARAILAASPAKQKTYGIPRKGGVHGSATLIKERNPDGAEENWKSVTGFLDKLAPKLKEDASDADAAGKPNHKR